MIQLLMRSSYYVYLNIQHSQIPRCAAQCIYVFCVDLWTNSDYFTVQH